MAQGFAREDGHITGVLDAVEIQVVAALLGQTLQVVAPPPMPAAADPLEALLAGCGLGEGGGVADDPGALADRDPALDRIVPPSHLQDEAAAAEYRRFTERSIRDRKATTLARAEQVVLALQPGPVALAPDDVESLVVALTDVRLLLADRMGLRTDADARRLEEAAEGLEPDDPAAAMLAYYDFVTWLQDALLGALMEGGD